MLAAGTVYRNDRRYNGGVLHVVAAESAGRPAELFGDSAIVVMGSARASETVVNVLLPEVFALAAGSGHSSMGLKNNVLA